MAALLLRNPQFRENLRELRNAAGLTQGQLVARMQVLGSNLTPSAYSKIELGERNIKVSDLVALQRVYKADYGAFFKDIEPGQ
jgi:transcriptional regulator with XRE-family HTH domain